MFIEVPQLIEHVQCFLDDQKKPDSDVFGMDIDLNSCPYINPSL
jgi:hypothetical protein